MVNRNPQGIPPPLPLVKDLVAPTETTTKAAKAAEKAPAAKANAVAANTTTKTMNNTLTTTGNATSTNKFGGKGISVKREVEANPFKALLDITDLIDMEGQSATGGPKEIEKEV